MQRVSFFRADKADELQILPERSLARMATSRCSGFGNLQTAQLFPGLKPGEDTPLCLLTNPQSIFFNACGADSWELAGEGQLGWDCAFHIPIDKWPGTTLNFTNTWWEHAEDLCSKKSSMWVWVRAALLTCLHGIFPDSQFHRGLAAGLTHDPCI